MNKLKCISLEDVIQVILIAFVLIMGVLILVKLSGCQPDPEPIPDAMNDAEIFDFDRVAERLDSIDQGLIEDNSVVYGPNGEPIPIPYATIVDPETFTELTAFSSDWSNVGLISRRSGLWRWITGDTLKSEIETLISAGGGGSITAEAADGTPTLTATTLQFNEQDGLSFADEGSGQAEIGLDWSILSAIGSMDPEDDTFCVYDSLVGQRSISLDGIFNSQFGGNGLMVKEADNFYVTRQIVAVGAETSVVNGTGVSGNPTVGIADNPVIPGTEGMTLPNGTTAQRPGTPQTFEMRGNTTTSGVEFYDGSAWTDLSGGGALLDSFFVTINIEDQGTTLPGTAGSTVGGGFFTVPAYLDGWNISYVGYAVAVAPAGGTYTAQLNKNGATNVFSASIADGARYAETSGAYAITTGDFFKVTLPINSAATTEPDGMVLHLILTR